MNETKEVLAVIREWMEASTMRSMENWRHFVKSTGLSMPQFGLLMRLHYGGGCEVHDIGSHLDISSAAASQMVDRLVQSGLVLREESPDDRRVRQVTLTAKGQELIQRGIAEHHGWVDDLVRELTPEQRSQALKAIPSLIEAEKRLPARRGVTPLRDAIRPSRDRP
jgi:DNA-binding MarR family transcriptional regulator